MSDYEARQRRRSLVVGFFVIVAVICFFWMIFKFGDLPILVSEIKSFRIYIQFPSAPGVQKDTPVRFCGYQIGRVTKVEPPSSQKDLNTGEYYFQVTVTASIDNQYYNKIPDKVEVKLMTRGLGSSYIELRVPPIDLRREKFLTEGRILQGSTGVASEFFPEDTQRKLDELIAGISILVSNSNDIIGDDENRANIKATLANIAEASKQATDVMQQLRETIALGKTTLKNTDERMERLADSLAVTSEKIGGVMANLESILDKINRGEGTAGKLVNDGRLYEQLLEDSRQLELILKDLKSFVEQSKEKGMPIKLK
jgi:phospholipid/cholesterol/gamma-HCH transport system substrate-binding protein